MSGLGYNISWESKSIYFESIRNMVTFGDGVGVGETKVSEDKVLARGREETTEVQLLLVVATILNTSTVPEKAIKERERKVLARMTENV
ncbi:hypothetical protein H6P81_017491 [Aristolochia fimbriata]|uniref:Uncharacterized protein n=1 Tax=Aristolochia fimbriata TaxID=158543 RepID=A0AAV7DYJ1_ARIFI|nr:hypothetical protein H6P81_017491 [Aristolochia fimbriata]